MPPKSKFIDCVVKTGGIVKDFSQTGSHCLQLCGVWLGSNGDLNQVEGVSAQLEPESESSPEGDPVVDMEKYKESLKAEARDLGLDLNSPRELSSKNAAEIVSAIRQAAFPPSLCFYGMASNTNQGGHACGIIIEDSNWRFFDPMYGEAQWDQNKHEKFDLYGAFKNFLERYHKELYDEFEIVLLMV